MRMSSARWTVISGLAAVAAIVVPIVLFAVDHQSKALTVETVSSGSVADLSDSALFALKLTYKDEPVTRVTTATIEVANTGTRPIERVDFERPLVIRFGEQRSVLAATLSVREPSNLKPSVDTDSAAVTISPLLLNPGDRFQLTVVLRGEFTEPSVDARISGIRGISRTTLRSSNLNRRAITSLIVGALTILGYGYLGGLTLLRRRSLTVIPIGDTLLLALVLGLAGSLLLVRGAEALAWSNRTILWAAVPAIVVLGGVIVLGQMRRRFIQAASQVAGGGEPPNKDLQPTATLKNPRRRG